MRVLLLHNRYRSQGGEERAVTEMAALLERRGHGVRVLERSSAALDHRRAARGLLTGGLNPDEVADAVREHGAEIVHAHNLHPLFGWRALAAARAAGARTVLQLHNFRLFCSIGVSFRHGRPCYSCRGRNTLPGVAHRCRGGIVESAVYAAGLHRQQPELLAQADAIVVLSRAHGGRLHELGVPPAKTTVVPNFIAASGWAQETRAGEGGYALVAGRLVEEKGFDTAVRAARAAGVPLVVAGTGPDEPRLRELAAGADVRFVGWVSAEELARLRAGAALSLAPSRCEEACPYSVLDALAAGLPTLVSDLGGLPELVARNAVLPVGDVGAWAAATGALWRDSQGRRSHGEAALIEARYRFGEARAYADLMAVYGCEP